MSHVQPFAISYTIRQARRAAGMNQLELAEKLGMSVQAISKWEIGENRPSRLGFSRLAKALGLSREELEWGYGVELPLVGPSEIDREGKVKTSGQTILLPALALGGAELARMLGKPGHFAWISRGDKLAVYAGIPDGAACVIAPPLGGDKQPPVGGPILVSQDGKTQVLALRNSPRDGLEWVNDDGVFPLPASRIVCHGSVLAAFAAIGGPAGFHPVASTEKALDGIPILTLREHQRFACRFLDLEKTLRKAEPKGIVFWVALSYPKAPERNTVDLAEVSLPRELLPSFSSRHISLAALLRYGGFIRNLTNGPSSGVPIRSKKRILVCETWAAPAPLLAFVAGKLSEEREFGEILDFYKKLKANESVKLGQGTPEDSKIL